MQTDTLLSCRLPPQLNNMMHLCACYPLNVIHVFLFLLKSTGGLSVGRQAFSRQNSKHHQAEQRHVICNKAA